MTLTLKRPEAMPSIAATASVMFGEFMALCPACKALQTVCLDNDRLAPTRKFSQHGRHVYHDCGSLEPCRLYRTY